MIRPVDRQSRGNEISLIPTRRNRFRGEYNLKTAQTEAPGLHAYRRGNGSLDRFGILRVFHGDCAIILISCVKEEDFAVERFYDNFGRRGLGILVLSAGFCLTGLLAFSSCDLGDDDNEMKMEPIEMRGFFISMNKNNVSDCQEEDVALHLEEGEVSTGEPNVRIAPAAGEDFADIAFGHVGVRVGMTDTHPETIASAYATKEDGNFIKPGLYFGNYPFNYPKILDF